MTRSTKSKTVESVFRLNRFLCWFCFVCRDEPSEPDGLLRGLIRLSDSFITFSDVVSFICILTFTDDNEFVRKGTRKRAQRPCKC